MTETQLAQQEVEVTKEDSRTSKIEEPNGLNVVAKSSCSAIKEPSDSDSDGLVE